ncbi:hypothetical protein DX634_22990 [Shigella sonnei]|nr:hypothetical protein [Shigella sonnei]
MATLTKKERAWLNELQEVLDRCPVVSSCRDCVLSPWICPYISRHLLSLNPLQARCRRYSRGER